MTKKILIIALIQLTQLNSLIAQDGILDASFDSDGIVTMDINNTNDVMKAILTQPDGKIIVAGHTTEMDLTRFCVIRFNSDGSLDTSFGSDGGVVMPFPFTSHASATALQNDGKIVVAGVASPMNEEGFAVVRFNADGTLDTNFGEGGIVHTSLPGGVVSKSMEIQPDGKIIVGGELYDNPPDGTSLVMVRYNQEGTLDSSFGIGGVSVTDVVAGSSLSALDMLNDIAIQQNGKIVACGFSGPNSTLLRFNSDGNLDLSFGLNGIWTQNFSSIGNSGFNSADIQQDGKIVSVGFSTDLNGSNDLLLTRHVADGSLDVSFGDSGIILTSLSPGQDGAEDVIVQADTKLLVGGFAVDSISRFVLARYDAAGNLDLSFGENGVVKTTIDPAGNRLSAIAIQADGKILATGVSGNAPSDVAIVRYTSTLLSDREQEYIIENVSIYPNPSQDEVVVAFASKLKGDVWIKVFDSTSRLLLEKTNLSITPGVTKRETLELGAFSSGIYFITIGMMDSHKTFKIMKK